MATKEDPKTYDLTIAVAFWTNELPEPGEFIMVVDDFEPWHVEPSRWHVERTFEGFSEGHRGSLHVYPQGLDGVGHLIRFQVIPSFYVENVPNYLIEVLDSHINVLSPGIRVSEQKHDYLGTVAHPTEPTQASPSFWRKWSGMLFFIGLLILIVAAALLPGMGDDGREPRTTALGVDEVSISVTLTARTSAAGPMLVRLSNETGGMEEHRVDHEIWDTSFMIASNASVTFEVVNLGDDGEVTCEVTRDGSLWSHATSTGGHVTANCTSFMSYGW